MRTWLRTNQAMGIILLVVFGIFLVYLLYSPWIHRKTLDAFTLGFFPIVSVVFLIICSAALVFDSHRREEVGELTHIGYKPIVTALLLSAVLYLYFMLMRVGLGFIATTLVFLFISAYVLGFRPWWKCVAWAVAIIALLYALFIFLGVSLPEGLVENILPF
ncbi:tripartite tricarboxylate transporter TctB family protein [Thermodesulfobacteriota bacterium]